MEELIVSFEIAKLANKKGFDEETLSFYYKEELCNDRIGKLNSYDCSSNNPLPFKDFENIIAAPTQSLLQKWIREKHQLHIEPTWNFSEEYKPGKFTEVFYSFVVIDISKEREWNVVANPNFQHSNGKQKTYEEALEAALKQALILIK